MTNLQALVSEWRRIAKAQWDYANDHDVTDRNYHIHAEAASTYTRCADDLEKAVAAIESGKSAISYSAEYDHPPRTGEGAT